MPISLVPIENITASIPSMPCIMGLKGDTACYVKSICDQVSESFKASAIALLIAYLLIDLVLPLIFNYLLPKVALNEKLAFLKEYEWQEKALSWLKTRLLFAFAIFTLYRLVV